MSFTCPRCERTSHNPNDERFGYCGACHQFTGEGMEELTADILAGLTLAAESRMAAMLFTAEELALLAGLVEGAITGVAQERGYGEEWSRLNSMRTVLREAQYGITREDQT